MTSDVLVIGGGIFGLWTARACLARGMTVTLADAARVGAGASGGMVGALAPHAPERWNEKKAFQLDALLGLPARIEALEAETGMSAGYARVGRLVPLSDAAARARARMRAEEARTRWRGARLTVEDAGLPGWLEPGPHGAQRDDLSARIHPRLCCAALRAAIERAGARVLEGRRMLGWDGAARFADGPIAAGATVIAAGWESFGLVPGLPADAGGGEHGQAALLDAQAPEGAPILYDGGVYVIAHARGVAVGSTSERGRTDRRTDDALDGVIARARALCPALRGAPVLERWAGVRPRARTRLPAIGPVPRSDAGSTPRSNGDRPRLLLATGGFKIGFAIAHRAGEAVAAMIAGDDPRLPAAFLPEALVRD